MATGGVNLSREFFELLKAVGESKSKQEEDRIIAKEVQRLKQKLEPPPPGQSSTTINPLLNSKKQAKEFLVRLLYVEMLGHDGSFGYIKAVEMAASASLFHKRTGYLVCGACLPPDHEFRFMLVNQMQRDLQSANVLECSGGLLACTNLITPDMVPAVHTEVKKLIAHDSATIRKKAIIALHKFHQLAPDVTTTEELQDILRRVLCDKDPSVMGSSLNVIQTMAIMDASPFKDLVPSLVSILKQICDHRLPSDYDYHRVPAPWMQLKIVRILAILGRADRVASNGMYEILSDTLKKADTGINAGYAIVYECVKTIVQIYPNTALLDAAADAIARFIDSRSHNLKYLGVTGLAMIVESHPQYAAQHQIAVMDCLEDSDETLQRKTLDLLYRMTNPVNVEFITEKLIHFLQGTTDLFLKKQLTERVCNIAEKYAPNNSWYIRTISKLFEVSGDMVAYDVAQNLMSLLAEGTGDNDESADMLLRQNAVEIYVNILKTKPFGTVPKILIETMAWCLGEYGYLSSISPIDEVLELLCKVAQHHKTKLHSTTRKFVISAIMKLIAQAGTCPPIAATVINEYTRSKDIDLQQRCLEFQAILTNCPNILPEILPVDASAEDVDVDVNLSFLNSYVQQKINEGMVPYSIPDDYDDDDDDGYGTLDNGGGSAGGGGFIMTPYEKPTQPTSLAVMSGIGSSTAASMGAPGPRTVSTSSVPLPPGAVSTPSVSHAPTPVPIAGPNQNLGLNTRNVANVWGKGGIANAMTAAPAPPAAGPPAATTFSATSPPAVSIPSNAWGSTASPYGGSSSPSAAAAPPPPIVKTAAQLEKERMAAALFGGIVPGSTLPQPQPAVVQPPAPRPAAAVITPAAAPAPPAPAPEVDLLDMGAWDDTPEPAPATSSVDPFGSGDTLLQVQPTTSKTTTSAAPVVETVSDDDDDMMMGGSKQANATTSASSQPAPVVVDDDPFASAGLLGDFNEKTLPSLMQNQKFEYNGLTLTALTITTAQFGQKWGTCPATVPVSILSSTKVTTLNQFMNTCATVGLHKIEAIAATNEGICSGMIGATSIILVHGKLTPTGSGTRIDATVKTTDPALASIFAMYMQTMLR